MADMPFAEVRMQITGGRVHVDSAPGLHEWVKERNNDEEWNLSPVIAVLFEDATGQASGQIWVAVFETTVKPFEVAPAVAEQLYKASREYTAGRALAISFFSEGWDYRIPRDLVSEEGLVPENYQALAEERVEQKLVTTIDLAQIDSNVLSVRTHNMPWVDGDRTDNQSGNAPAALQKAAEALARLNQETPNQEES